MESLEIGIVTTCIGVGTVFGVLAVLTIVIWLLNKAMDSTVFLGEKNEEVSKQTAEIGAAKKANEEITPTIVAAIMAAVANTTGIPAEELKFLAIRRTDAKLPVWAAAGLNEIIAERQRHTGGGVR